MKNKIIEIDTKIYKSININSKDIVVLGVSLLIFTLSIMNSLWKKIHGINELNELNEDYTTKHVVLKIIEFVFFLIIAGYLVFNIKLENKKLFNWLVFAIISYFILYQIFFNFSNEVFSNRFYNYFNFKFFGDTSFDNQIVSIISFSVLLFLIFRYFSIINNPSKLVDIKTHDIIRIMIIYIFGYLVFFSLIFFLLFTLSLSVNEKFKKPENNIMSDKLNKFTSEKGIYFIIVIALGLLLILYMAMNRKYDIRTISRNSKIEKTLDIIFPIKINKYKSKNSNTSSTSRTSSVQAVKSSNSNFIRSIFDIIGNIFRFR